MARKASRKGTGPRKGAGRKRDYAAEYAKRTAGTKPGTAARQAARGHKPPPGKTEAQLKRERQEARIEAFAEKQANRWPGQSQADLIVEALREQIKIHGMRYLRQLERVIADMERQLASAPPGERGRKSLGMGMSGMDALAERYHMPVETFGYH